MEYIHYSKGSPLAPPATVCASSSYVSFLHCLMGNFCHIRSSGNSVKGKRIKMWVTLRPLLTSPLALSCSPLSTTSLSSSPLSTLGQLSSSFFSTSPSPLSGVGGRLKQFLLPLLLGELNITDLDVRPLQSRSSWWTQLTGEHHALSLLVTCIT